MVLPHTYIHIILLFLYMSTILTDTCMHIQNISIHTAVKSMTYEVPKVAPSGSPGGVAPGELRERS